MEDCPQIPVPGDRPEQPEPWPASCWGWQRLAGMSPWELLPAEGEKR